MILRTTSLALALALATPAAWAHGNEKHPPKQIEAGRETAGAEQTVPPEAADAVAVLERFSTASVLGSPLMSMFIPYQPSSVPLASRTGTA